jgi:hypothetical protein
MVWASIPILSSFFCGEGFVLVVGAFSFCVLNVGVSAALVLVGYMSVMLVFLVCFSAFFETV